MCCLLQASHICTQAGVTSCTQQVRLYWLLCYKSKMVTWSLCIYITLDQKPVLGILYAHRLGRLRTHGLQDLGMSHIHATWQQLHPAGNDKRCDLLFMRLYSSSPVRSTLDATDHWTLTLSYRCMLCIIVTCDPVIVFCGPVAHYELVRLLSCLYFSTMKLESSRRKVNPG